MPNPNGTSTPEERAKRTAERCRHGFTTEMVHRCDDFCGECGDLKPVGESCLCFDNGCE